MVDFNPRMSRVAPTPSKTRQKKEEENAFMHLSDREIAGCISDIGIAFSVPDLQKPSPQLVQRVFEWFADVLTNTVRANVAPAMKAAAEDVGGHFSDIYSNDTRDLLGLFVALRRLLGECGVHDLTFNDLYRPTHPRLVKIFSYVINFVRFRESQTEVIDEHFNKCEGTKQRIESLYTENQNKEQQLTELERNSQSAQAAIREKETRSNELKNRLLELKRSQERVTEKLEQMKGEQSRLKAILEERTVQTMNIKQESQKLRPYTEQSPASLEDSLRELSNQLSADKSQIDTLDRRSRALQTSCDAFSTVTGDVQVCTSLLKDLKRDLTSEESMSTAAARNRDALSERSNNVRDVERQERVLKSKLKGITERTDKLRHTAEERREGETKRMEELKQVNQDIKNERTERNREMERRKVRIEQTEKKMADMKENMENEIQATHDEYIKMDAHVRLYIKEMEQNIS